MQVSVTLIMVTCYTYYTTDIIKVIVIIKTTCTRRNILTSLSVKMFNDV